MLIEMFALELDYMSDQQLSILIGHSDEAAMEAICVEWVGNGINTQHFEVGLKEHLAGKEQGAGENFIYLEGLIECDADTAGADVDGPLDERSLRLVALRLKTDAQGDGDAIKLAAIRRRRLRGRAIRWHGEKEYSKKRLLLDPIWRRKSVRKADASLLYGWWPTRRRQATSCSLS